MTRQSLELPEMLWRGQGALVALICVASTRASPIRSFEDLEADVLPATLVDGRFVPFAHFTLTEPITLT